MSMRPWWKDQEAVELASGVLANRRSSDCCDSNECFYPTLPLLAEAVLSLSARIEAAEKLLQRGTA